MSPEIKPNIDLISARIEGGEIQRYKFTVEATRHRCTVVLDGLEGILEVRKSSDSEGLQLSSNRPGIKWLSFDAEPGEYEIAIQNGEAASDHEIYVVAANSEAPNILHGKFTPPLEGMALTTEEYGHLGDPWGNSEEAPYLKGPEGREDFYKKYFHLGADFIAAPGTPVCAVANGKVVKVGHSGDEWGYHVVVEHSFEGEDGESKIITVVYEHLQEEGRPELGAELKAGQKIGKIWDMNVPGEVPHLHLCAHEGQMTTSSEEVIGSTAGAAHFRKLAVGLKRFINVADPKLYTPLS